MHETIGDLNRLDCPHCGKGGLDDLWDGGLDFAGLEGVIEGVTEADCGHCGAVCSVSVTCTVVATAKVVKPGEPPTV